MITRKQGEARARKYRLIAGGLYQDLRKADNDCLPREVKDHLRAAHDAMCEAFRALEDWRK